jgi:hypothetical protein
MDLEQKKRGDIMKIFDFFGEIIVNDKASDTLSKVGKNVQDLGSNATKNLKVFGVEINEGLMNLGKWGLGITTAIAGASAALFAIANDVAQATDRIDKMAERTGISRGELQRWEFALSQSGGKVETLVIGMKTLSNTLDSALSGTKQSQEAFSRLGLEFETLKTKTPSEILDIVTKRLADMEQGTERNAIGNQLLGRSYVEMLPFLNAGSDGIEKMKTKADELGLVMSDLTIKNGVGFIDLTDQMNRSLTAIRYELAKELLPAFNSLLSWFVSSIPSIRNWIDNFKTGFSALSNAVMTSNKFLIDGFILLRDGILGVWTAIITGVGARIDDMLSLVSKFVEAVNKVFKTDFSVPKFQEIGKNIAEGIEKGIKGDGKLEAISKALEGMLNDTEKKAVTATQNTTKAITKETEEQKKTIIVNSQEVMKKVAESQETQKNGFLQMSRYIQAIDKEKKENIEENIKENETAQTDYLSFIFNKTSENANKIIEVTKEEKAEQQETNENFLSWIANATSINTDTIVEITKKGKKQQEEDDKDYEKKYKEHYENLTKKSEEETKKVNTNWQELGKVISQAVKKTSTEAGELIDATMAIGVAATKAIAGDYVGAISTLLQNFDLAITKTIEYSQTIAKHAKETIAEMIKNSQKEVNGLIETLGYLASNITEKTKDTFDNFGKTFESTTKAIENGFKEIDTFVGMTLSEMEKKGLEASTNLIATIITESQNAFKVLQELIADLTSIAVSEGDKLGTAIITALKNRHEEEEKLEISNYEKKIKQADEYFSEMKGKYDEDLINRLASIDDEFRETLQAKNAQLTEEEKTIKFITDKRKERDYEEKKSKLEEKVLYATTEEEKVQAWEEYALLLANKKKEAITAEIKDVVATKQKKIDEAKEEYNEKVEILKATTEAEKEANKTLIEQSKEKWKEIRENYEYEQEAMRLATAKNQDETIKLLETYNSKWAKTGKSFGEQLVQGYLETTPPIFQSINDILSKIDSVRALTKKAEEEQEKLRLQIPNFSEKNIIELKGNRDSSGEFIPQVGGGVTQNITINSPTQLDPFEISRQIRNTSQQLVWEV